MKLSKILKKIIKEQDDEDCIYGCMDSNAVNYDPNATCWGDPLGAMSWDTDGNYNNIAYGPFVCQYQYSCDTFDQWASVLYNLANINQNIYGVSFPYNHPDAPESVSEDEMMDYICLVCSNPNVYLNQGQYCPACFTGFVFGPEGTGTGGGLSMCSCCPDIPGCTDSNATNYNPYATTDDGSCEYPFNYEALEFCCDGNSFNYGMDATGVNINSTVTWPIEGPGFGDNYVDTYLMLGGINGNLGQCNNSICNYDTRYRCDQCGGCTEDPFGPFSNLTDCQNSGCFDLNQYALDTYGYQSNVGVDNTVMSSADQFCIKCQSSTSFEASDSRCSCCDEIYTYSDDTNILTYNPEDDPDFEGLPPLPSKGKAPLQKKLPKRDPQIKRMRKLAGIKEQEEIEPIGGPTKSPNELAYFDFKSWAYEVGTKELFREKKFKVGEIEYTLEEATEMGAGQMFDVLTQIWTLWTKETDNDQFGRIKDENVQEFGKALYNMMKKDGKGFFFKGDERGAKVGDDAEYLKQTYGVEMNEQKETLQKRAGIIK